MGKQLKENWMNYLIGAVIVIATGVITSSFLANNAKVHNAAPIEYVDEKVKTVSDESKIRDIEIKEELELKADKEDFDKMQETINTMNDRIYDLWKNKYE